MQRGSAGAVQPGPSCCAVLAAGHWSVAEAAAAACGRLGLLLCAASRQQLALPLLCCQLCLPL